MVDERRRSPLATSADALRVLDAQGHRLRDLPRRSGVSKEAIAMALGVLAKAGLVEVRPAPAGQRGRVVRVTDLGAAAQVANASRLAGIEEAWRGRFGIDAIDGVGASLEALIEPAAKRSPLFLGLQPQPGSWRASVPIPATLPCYPMVLHRGVYPDGS